MRRNLHRLGLVGSWLHFSVYSLLDSVIDIFFNQVLRKLM